MFKVTLVPFNTWSWRTRAIAAVVLGISIWLMFFDSHSLIKRVTWHREYVQLREENAALEEQIKALDERMEQGISDEMVEQIAREQYGMQRPGETVYRVDTPGDD
jgi:cell division protein FtsB